MFAIGFICGVTFSILVVVTLAFFRSAIEKRVIVIEKTLQAAGPQPRGFIIEPEDEADLARQEIIERNRREGRDTKVSELTD